MLERISLKSIRGTFTEQFVLQSDNRMIPVEVKAEENLRAKSLRQFVLDHEGTHGVRLSMSPYREQDWMTNYPLYAAELIV